MNTNTTMLVLEMVKSALGQVYQLGFKNQFQLRKYSVVSLNALVNPVGALEILNDGMPNNND